MDWRAGRTAMAVLVLGALGAAGGPWGGAAPDPAPESDVGPALRCPDPVVLDGDGHRWLLCHGTRSSAVLAVCPPSRAVRRGDRLRPSLRGFGCRTSVSALTAAHRLRLGLRLDVNRASTADLTAVPGIGPVTARRIVHGRPWRSVDALSAVRGIGPRRLARIARGLRATSSPPLAWPSPRPPGASSPRRP